MPQGGKYWRYDYRFAGKRKTLAIGVYSEVSLAEARNAHMRARTGLLEGIVPAEHKKIHKLTRDLAQSDTFEAIATGRAQDDPTDALSEAMTARRKKHHASITDPVAHGFLLRGIEGFEGTVAEKAALQLSALLFQRPGEIRHIEWSEIN